MCKSSTESASSQAQRRLSVAVLGVGAMGCYVAAEYALAGHDVRITASARTSARLAVERVLEAAGGGLSASQVTYAESAGAAAKGADLVSESLPEDLAVKQRELLEAQRAAPDAILTTNTSSFTVTAIAAALDDPSRLIGAHYVNPPWAFTIMELIAGEQSDPALVAEVDSIVRGLGRTPIRITGDVPGFVFNRLQFALLREATELVQAGVVSADDLDSIVVRGIGRRWAAVGPLTSATLGGRKLFRQLAERLYPELSSAATPAEIEPMVPTPTLVAEARRERDRRLAHSDENEIPRLWRARLGDFRTAA